MFERATGVSFCVSKRTYVKLSTSEHLVELYTYPPAPLHYYWLHNFHNLKIKVKKRITMSKFMLNS